jgi:IclR family acetate operon transcriptional repressor
VQGATRLGRPSIAHATAAGKVMLAFSDRRPQLPLARYTERTIVDEAVLAAELERVRRRGFAEGYEERERDLNAIAAPAWSTGGDLAAIVSLHGPARRFGRAAARRALPLLLDHTAQISRKLGGHAGPNRAPGL